MTNECILIPSRPGFCIKLLFIFIILVSISSTWIYSQSSWYWIQPKPTGNMLYSVCFPDVTTGYAAGALGTIIRTTDGGSTWDLQNSKTGKDLLEIFFIDNTNGFAVGKDGVILGTGDGGKNWFPKASGIKSYLHDITFTNKSTGYIAGLSGTILKTNNGGNKWIQLKTGLSASFFCISFLNANTGVTGGYNIILKTTNGGKTFSELNANIDPSSALVGISYIDCNTIYAAGNSLHGTFYKSTNAGIDWTNRSLTLPYLFDGSVDLVRSMSFLNKNVGFVVTDFGTILKTSDGGNNWFNDSSFRPSYTKLSIMYDISFTDCFNLYISGGGGTVISSKNAGMDWFAVTGNERTLYKNYFTDKVTGFSVGENGTILKTEDGGLSWKNLRTFTTKDLRAMYFGNSKTGFVAGNRGVTFKTTDLGSTWIDQTHYMNLDYHDIHFTDNDVGIVAGGNPENERAFIYKTTNGGTNWYEVYDSLGLGVLNSIAYIDNSKWVVAGDNGNILKTTDAGERWESHNLSKEDLNSIAFTNPLNGLISGNFGAVFRTTDGGIKWEKRSSGNFASLNSIKYLNAENVIAAGDEGAIIISNDGGIKWTMIPTVTDNDLFYINALNNELFAFGEYGTIINSKVSSNIFAAGLEEYNINPESHLLQNFPNPFNPETTINFVINKPGNVIIKIYDVLGKEAFTFVNKNRATGSYSLIFNGSNLPGGIYFYNLVVDNKIAATRKMLMLK